MLMSFRTKTASYSRRGEAARLAISRPIVLLLLHLSFIFSSISTTSDGRQTVAAVVVMSPLP